MVSSLDGVIAKKDNSVSWFEISDNCEKGAFSPDVEEFLKTIDCYVMGSRTSNTLSNFQNLMGVRMAMCPSLW